MKEKKLVIGTQNPKKLEEIQSILKEFPVTVVSLDEFPKMEEVEENGRTYEENATIKALAFSKATGLPCIADDTGLEVDALSAEPGLYSARWAGVEGPGKYEANNKKMLEQLKDVPFEKRTAKFYCTIVLVKDGKRILSCTGICPGKIREKLTGDKGFGYDPLFEVDGYNKTFAEMEHDFKNTISHRGRALEKFKQEFAKLENFFE